jgi:NADPH:quinone reductase
VKAIGVVEYGGPEVLQWVTLPEPIPGPNEVRLRVLASTVNPADTLLRSGALAARNPELPPPYVPGMEVSGLIDAIGDEVKTTWQIGERVMAYVVPKGTHGGYSEKVAVPAASVARMPRTASFAEAATLPMNGLTARRALDVLDLRPGQVLGVTGAAGAVGGYSVELGKAAGLTVVADASQSDVPLLEKLGADVVIPRGPQFATMVRTAVPSGVDGLIDAGLLGTAVLGAVADRGRVATVRKSTLPGSTEMDSEREITMYLVSVRDYALEQAKLERLGQLVDEGRLSLRVAKTLPAGQAADAHRALEAGGTRGRLVLTF